MAATLSEGTTARDFGEFVDRERTRLVRATLLLTGDPAEAEDIAQEALARVLERWGRVSGMDSPDGCLYRTALNVHRKRLRRIALAARATVGPTRRDELAATESRLDALRAIASLPRPQREAIVLVEWLGYTAEEAGRLVGIKAVSVRTRLHRAKEALRKELGDSDG